MKTLEENQKIVGHTFQRKGSGTLVKVDMVDQVTNLTDVAKKDTMVSFTPLSDATRALVEEVNFFLGTYVQVD